MKKLTYPILLIFLLSSCFKKEKGIVLPEGESTISTCFTGTDQDHYSKQMYFDLSANVFQESQLADWDLCFESSDTGIGIFTNTGTKIKIRRGDFYNLNEPKTSTPKIISDIMNAKELWDGSDGKTASSIVGDWRKYTIPDGSGGTLSGIYFIELSYLQGDERYRRLQILKMNDTAFYCNIARLNENTPAITEIRKNKLQNYTYYTFKNGGHIVDNAEPSKNNWDFVFTRYTTIIPVTSTTTMPYLLAGVFSNHNNVLVAIDSTSQFENININNLSNYKFKDDKDAIGYAWKTYDFSNGLNGKWSVNSKITYIIKDTDAHFYKLRFLDFIDKQNRSGNPKFEYIQIK